MPIFSPRDPRKGTPAPPPQRGRRPAAPSTQDGVLAPPTPRDAAAIAGAGSAVATAGTPGAAPVTRDGVPATNTATGPTSLSRAEWGNLRRRMVSQISAGLGGKLARSGGGRTAENLALLSESFAALCQQAQVRLSDGERQTLLQQITDEIVGYGPLEPLLRDASISEVMVNGPNQVYIEREGKLTLTDVHFDDDEHVMWVIDRIIRPLGRRVDRSLPMVDARLPDGSRVNAIIPPGAIDGPTLTIRKFSKEKLTMKELIAFGSLTQHMADFLQACVVARLNIIVSGGTGSGKTTFLNILSGFVPADERIVTIEDSAELQLQQPHVVRLEAQRPDLDGSGEVTIRDLVRNSLRMRPNRIIVGEVRGGEALDMLQAMNTGHDGSMTTVHANTPRDAIARLETLALMAGYEIPVGVLRRQIAAAVDLIVQQSRFRDGSRKVVNVTEVQGMEGDVVVMEDIFVFQEMGRDAAGNVVGDMHPTGIRPRCDARLQAAGFDLPSEVYMRGMPTGSWSSAPGRH
jgi:pilus assembly protein CpaF